MWMDKGSNETIGVKLDEKILWKKCVGNKMQMQKMKANRLFFACFSVDFVIKSD